MTDEQASHDSKNKESVYRPLFDRMASQYTQIPIIRTNSKNILLYNNHYITVIDSCT